MNFALQLCYAAAAIIYMHIYVSIMLTVAAIVCEIQT